MLLQFLESRSNDHLQLKLDHGQYSESDLVEVRVALNLPYINDSKHFEDYSGDTTINGHHYRFVKRKLVNNELVLLCVRDQQKDRLQKAGTDFYKQVNDMPGSEKKSKTAPLKLVKGFANEFTFSTPHCLTSWCIEPRDEYPVFVESFTSVFPSTPVQPPNA